MSLRRFLLLVLSVAAAAPAPAKEPVSVLAEPVLLDPRDPRALAVGGLDYRGGLALRSGDPRFGGFSGIHVSDDGASLLAISDRAGWLLIGLRYDAAGRLAGVGTAELGPLIGADGEPLSGAARDAESFTMLPDGSMLVGFERRHRILHYPAASPPFSKRPREFPAPAGLEKAPPNAGLEALSHLGGGVLVGITERLSSGDGAVAAWIGNGGNWQPFAYVPKAGLRVTDAGVSPDGDLFVLEHHYSRATGSTVRIARVPRAELAPGRRVEGREVALLAPPLSTDNFEGIALRRGANGETLIYVMSDDNFNPEQRTLLFMFALKQP